MENAHSGLENLNLTSDEVDKFQTAFKDETFKKMFAEYAKEISDPKNKAESDAYLKQLEMEGKIEQVYGKDVQLIMPKPGFVAKTFQEEQEVSKEGDEGSDRGSETEKQPPEKGRKHKAFVNVCHSEKVADATSEKRPGGLQWSVPHTLGQPHDEVDKQGEVCVAYDFCVSERTFQLTQTDERLQTMVVETAIEAVNKAFGKTYQMDFTLPKKTFMGPKTGPGVQALKGKKVGGGGGEGSGPKGRIPPIAEQSQSSATESGFRFDKALGGTKKQIESKKEEAPAKNANGETTPKHTVIHRDTGKDMSKQFGVGSASREAERRHSDTRPNSLVLRVECPLLDSMATAELDVGDARVFFRVPGIYLLDLSLPFTVMSNDGNAKFDKKTKSLEITLPVRPAVKAPAPAFTEPEVETGEEPLAETDVGETTVTEPRESVVSSDQSVDTATSSMEETPPDELLEQPVTSTARSVKQDDAEAKAKASASAAVAAAEEFARAGETENQRKWREICGGPKRGSPDNDGIEPGTIASEDGGLAEEESTTDSGQCTEENQDTASAVRDTGEHQTNSKPKPKPVVTATFLKPSLRGAAELGSELD